MATLHGKFTRPILNFSQQDKRCEPGGLRDGDEGRPGLGLWSPQQGVQFNRNSEISIDFPIAFLSAAKPAAGLYVVFLLLLHPIIQSSNSDHMEQNNHDSLIWIWPGHNLLIVLARLSHLVANFYTGEVAYSDTGYSDTV